MLHADIPDFVLVSAIFFGAGLVKGVLGMGMPTFAMGFLGLLMPVPQAASLLTLPALVTNAWQAVVGGPVLPLVRRLWPLLVGIVAGVSCAGLVPSLDARVARMVLGGCLALYGASGLAGFHLPAIAARWQPPTGLLAGAATGVITSMTGVNVLPMVPWLQALRLERRELTQALGLSFTTSTAALGVLLAARGHLGAGASLQSALALLPAVAGMLLGQLVRDELPEPVFRRCFFAGLVLLGAWLSIR